MAVIDYNLYGFEHLNQDRQRLIRAKSFQAAQEQFEESERDNWILIQAWNADCILTWDVFRSDKQQLPATIS